MAWSGVRTGLARGMSGIIGTLCVVCGAWAQQLTAPEPALPMPRGGQETTTLRVTTNEVLVPTLVEKDHGQVVYGLKAADFVVDDNGVPQQIQVQEEMDTAPVALVVAVEQGRSSALEFDKEAKLGPLLDLFLSDGKGEAALVGFDSQPQLIRDFTHSAEEIGGDLRHLAPGNGGAAILDTVGYAVDLLQSQPKEYRRVLLLISEERDHGSKRVKPEKLIERIGLTDVLVLSVSFSPSKAEFLHDAKDNGTNRILSPMGALFMAVQGLKKNVAAQIAHMSGGEYATFTRDKGFQEQVAEVAKHARNRYLISFHPTDATPGLHTLKVRLREDLGARVVARANYWAAAEQ